MDVAYSRHGERREMHIESWKETLKERGHLEDLVIGGRVIELGWEGMDWIDLDQDRGQYPLVNVVLTFGFHKY